MIAERLKGAIHTDAGLGESLTPAEYADLQSLLADPKNLPYYFVGCHGPDPFFFNTKDVSGTLATFVAAYNDVADFIADFEKMLLDAVPQPVLDALAAFDEFADDVIQDSSLLSEIQQTFDDLNQVLQGFAALLSEALKRFVSEFNLFDLVSHPYRDGEREGEWWWFDAMHYRRTGKFASALLEATRGASGPEHLYALGYLTHVAADTVGHAYVNLYCGGPYRSQAQRHKTGENYQDVSNLLQEFGVDFNHSKLHHLYNFNFDGGPDPDAHTVMPPDLCALIADTLNAVFQEDGDPDPDYATRITAGDVDDTYRLWYRFMKGFTETGTLPPPVPYSLTAELREVWDKAVDNLGDVGDFLKDAIDKTSGFGILSIFLALAAAVAAAVLAAAAIADAVAGGLATLGTATIRYAACLIYEQLYNAFQTFRLALSLNGLGFPMVEHLTEPRLRQFASPDQDDPTGVDARDVAPFEPLLRFTADLLPDPLAVIFHQERHLIYPLTDGEKRAVRPAPASYFTQPATHPAFGRIPLDRDLVEQLVDLAATGTADEDELLALLEGRTLGNALALSAELYDRWFRGARIPDFNLDSDRGYGYLCWAQPGDTPHEPSPLRTHDSAGDPTEVELHVLP
ncbi:zinc dependent phospholipase C family protein [Ornithinimicrobium sp. W1665]|uniref:zinc dependent phospholipase C family protein n=1 Tax=Ornithinimicrobium sp. W1665 TaxID=3416666 RepID=UPI003CEB50D6